jgi:hypothetical protein
MILRDSVMRISQRFALREHAVEWADSLRADIEKGWDEWSASVVR